MNLQQALYKFLREGDEHTPLPKDCSHPMQLEIDAPGHRYLAKFTAAWLERHYTVTPKPHQSQGQERRI